MCSRFPMRWSTDSLEALERHELDLLEVLNDCIGPGSTVSFTLGTLTEMAERIPYYRGFPGRLGIAMRELVNLGYLMFAPTCHGGVQISIGGCRALTPGSAFRTDMVIDSALHRDRAAWLARLEARAS